MKLFDAILDGLGGFLEVLFVAPAAALAAWVRRLNNRSKTNQEGVDELKTELNWDDEEQRAQRLETMERDMDDIRESLKRQERQHDRVESYLVGDEDVPHDSVFERLESIEDKIDD